MVGSLSEISQELENAGPEEILRWAAQCFGQELAVACSFGGPSGMVLLDMLSHVDASIPVYFLDTQLLFKETYELIDSVRERYGIEAIAVAGLTLQQQAEACGDELWERDPDLCCNLRKVRPQREFLKGYSAWVSGIRRDQAASRSGVPIVGEDPKFDLVKINPLANWTEAMVWTYIKAHGVPYNALHDQGYPSIGCFPCTAQVLNGESSRAGRWKGFAKMECGLHS